MKQRKTRGWTLVLALLLLLSACGGNTREEAVPADTMVSAEPSVPAVEEDAADPVEPPVNDVVSAADRISSIEEAGAYLQSVEEFDQPFDACRLFADLVADDYDEVGLIHLHRWDNYYCLAYVREGEIFYPVDPFILARGGDGWFADPKYNCASSADLTALCDTLRETFPYNGENNPMDSWETEILSGGALPEEPVVSVPAVTPKPTPAAPSTPEETLLADLTTPQYTREQIDQWVAEGLTLEQWAEKITVPADVVQLLNAINYREKEYNDNVTFHDDALDVEWGSAWNAQTVFNYRSGNCTGTSNIVNALLSGDFDQQGYVESNGANGGHIFNYFVADGIYVFCDFVGIPGSAGFGNGRTYAADTREYISYVASSPQEFGDWYLNDGYFSHEFDDANVEGYLYHLFMYPREGTKIPKGFDANSEQTKFGNCVWDVLPQQYQDGYSILYEREGHPIRFVPILDVSAWPKEIR